MAQTDDKIDDKTVKLYIGGICTSWTNEYLGAILSAHGSVKRVDVVKHYAFGFAETKEDADKIIAGVSGKTFEGYRIVVQISKNKQNLPDCEDLCFECGKGGHWAKECAQRKERYARTGGPPPRRGAASRGAAPYDRSAGRHGGRYDHYGPPSAYDRGHYARDPYGRDPYARDPYGRDPYARDPYARGPYSRDPYGRDPYARDPYARDPYARDPYARDPYAAKDPYGYPAPVQRYEYRERSPAGRRYADPYMEERQRVAYGSAEVDTRVAALRPTDPYAVASRAVADPYSAAPRPAVDPYVVASRPAVDPYAVASRTASADPYAVTSRPAVDPYSVAARPATDPYAVTSRAAADPYAVASRPVTDPYAVAQSQPISYTIGSIAQ